jgi:hypothetical protein
LGALSQFLYCFGNSSCKCIVIYWWKKFWSSFRFLFCFLTNYVMPYIMVLLLGLLGINLHYIIYKWLLINIVYHCWVWIIVRSKCIVSCYRFDAPVFLRLADIIIPLVYPIRSYWFGKSTVWSFSCIHVPWYVIHRTATSKMSRIHPCRELFSWFDLERYFFQNGSLER